MDLIYPHAVNRVNQQAPRKTRHYPVVEGHEWAAFKKQVKSGWILCQNKLTKKMPKGNGLGLLLYIRSMAFVNPSKHIGLLKTINSCPSLFRSISKWLSCFESPHRCNIWSMSPEAQNWTNKLNCTKTYNTANVTLISNTICYVIYGIPYGRVPILLAEGITVRF